MFEQTCFQWLATAWSNWFWPKDHFAKTWQLAGHF